MTLCMPESKMNILQYNRRNKHNLCRKICWADAIKIPKINISLFGIEFQVQIL